METSSDRSFLSESIQAWRNSEVFNSFEKTLARNATAPAMMAATMGPKTGRSAEVIIAVP
jgi:hypothetical protein